jgi:transposase-like protein
LSSIGALVEVLAVTLESPRELRGLEILGKGDAIHRLDSDHYSVDSQNGHGSYSVVKSGKEWTCECPDYTYRQVVCKHIWSVYFSLNLRQRVVTKVQPEIDFAPEKENACRKCSSPNIVKVGKIRTKHGEVQRYRCRDCDGTFVDNETGFEYVKATPKAITLALDSYFKGLSQRDIVDQLKNVEGIEVSQPCVHKWIHKYVEVMKTYLDKFTPQLGGMWHADETMINVRDTEKMKIGEAGFEGNYSWMWNVMDHETRFLIASQVTKHRDIVDARKVLSQAKDVANGQRPDFIITDKLHAYNQAITKEFFTLADPKTKHVKLKNLKEGTNNNIIERLHGTIKERTKVMRGMDTDESAKLLLEGQRIHYNYLRPHQALKGKTPAEKAGIDLKLEGNKWKELIQRGKRTQKVIEEKGQE